MNQEEQRRNETAIYRKQRALEKHLEHCLARLTPKNLGHAIAEGYAKLNEECEEKDVHLITTPTKWSDLMIAGLQLITNDDNWVKVNGREIYIEYLFGEVGGTNTHLRCIFEIGSDTSIDEQVEDYKKALVDDAIEELTGNIPSPNGDAEHDEATIDKLPSEVDSTAVPLIRDSNSKALKVYELVGLLKQLDQDASVHWVKESKYGVTTSTEKVRYVEQVTEDNNTFVTLN